MTASAPRTAFPPDGYDDRRFGGNTGRRDCVGRVVLGAAGTVVSPGLIGQSWSLESSDERGNAFSSVKSSPKITRLSDGVATRVTSTAIAAPVVPVTGNAEANELLVTDPWCC
jgi:hypothetical protein